eukprot:CAMPEP_0172179072 /NCGR_PEP_ID=MMETSP1050-20130122/16403_1 /TAXON_ID=233186 /ORGANISM="Cryptomonas curvata, Strain CCAP979/52" /LENGTH=101 /DNA_ID=CAMNT_0012851891 /DNA_START=163 /DNA_END=468 /DNA_ORIENTATION=-
MVRIEGEEVRRARSGLRDLLGFLETGADCDGGRSERKSSKSSIDSSTSRLGEELREVWRRIVRIRLESGASVANSSSGLLRLSWSGGSFLIRDFSQVVEEV